MMAKRISSFVVLGAFLFSAVCLAAEASFTYDDHGRRDPFWKLVNAGGAVMNYDKDLQLTDMVLEGIMTGESNNIAIINGVIVKAEDKVGLFTVVDIKPDTVVLQKGQDTFTLILKKED